jgi:N utilization substance protein A
MAEAGEELPGESAEETTAQAASGDADEDLDEPELPDEDPLPGSEGTPLPDDELGGGGDESPRGPESAGQAGDDTDLPEDEEASSESVQELVDDGQYYEAEVVDGVENAPPADEAEVTTHERPMIQGEEIPDEEERGKGN